MDALQGWKKLVGPPEKPIDVGDGIVSCSVGGDGSLVAMGAIHKRVGFVEFTALPPFDDGWRYDPEAVRRYRSWMMDSRHAFLRFEVGPAAPRHIERFASDDSCRHRLVFDEQDIEIETRAEGGSIVQQIRFVRRDLAARGALVFRGRLDRPALGQVTEGGPLPPTGARTQLTARREMLIASAPELPVKAVVTVSGGRGGWITRGDEALLEVDGETPVDISLTFDPLAARRGGDVARPAVHLPVPGVAGDVAPDLHWMVRRALAYVVGCTALHIDDDVCILTDHRILPLSWTRDAYWQALLLLRTRRAIGGRDPVDVVAAHLRWLWRRAERPRNLWSRSHLPNGRVKDPGYQADQQLYPLLELCDYIESTGELPKLGPGSGPETWGRLVGSVWSAVPTAEGEDLVPSEENPADDPLELPFLLSNQILRWRAASRLHAFKDYFGEAAGIDFAAAARRMRAAIDRVFAYENGWSYATDGGGRHATCGDANDVPIALAPMWGFCSATDERWQATIRFIFSKENPAYHPGEFGGLGSPHTRGVWTLGDIQEWVAFAALDDAERSAKALRRLVHVASPDGLLPEAYDAHTGRASARPWFAWPGALLGALLYDPEGPPRPS